MLKNFEMLIMTEESVGGQYKVTVEVTNIGIYTGTDREMIRAKEIAMTKVCYLILKLSGIVNGTLKVKDYIALNPMALQPKRNVPMVRRSVVQQQKKVWSETESEESEESDDSDDEDSQNEENLVPTYSEIFKKNLVSAQISEESVALGEVCLIYFLNQNII